MKVTTRSALLFKVGKWHPCCSLTIFSIEFCSAGASITDYLICQYTRWSILRLSSTSVGHWLVISLIYHLKKTQEIKNLAQSENLNIHDLHIAWQCISKFSLSNTQKVVYQTSSVRETNTLPVMLPNSQLTLLQVISLLLTTSSIPNPFPSHPSTYTVFFQLLKNC